VRTSRIELETPGWKPGTLPLRHARINFIYMVGDDGFEPTQQTQQIYSLPRLSNFGDHPNYYLGRYAGLSSDTSLG